MGDGGAYAFDLRQVCGGYAYYSTFTHGQPSQDDRYEIRTPSIVNIERFTIALSELGQAPTWIDSEGPYRQWLYNHGWALADVRFARSRMTQWLKQHKCVISALQSFTDKDIVSPSALARSYRGKAKRDVHERDGGRCLVCGGAGALTLQHVTPYSLAGETSSRNMVTLCEPCNQAYADEMDRELYRLAGLPFGLEPSLLKDAPDRKVALRRAAYLSSNLMHTRCDVW